jgi:CcmD family protein
MMTRLKRPLVALSMWLLAVSALAGQPPSGQEGFVPISQLPPADQLPAAPLLITAYAFVWVALMAYLWSIWRRLRKVEADMQALERRSAQRGGAR